MKSRLREFQDKAANSGWRIQLIPYDDPSKVMMVETNWYALTGMAVFLFGLFRVVETDNLQFLYLAIGGFVFAGLGLIFKGRMKRRGWKKIRAKCVDKELRKIRMSRSGSNYKGWYWRFLCEFYIEGNYYRVTPLVHWINHVSEVAAENFYDEISTPDEYMVLLVNPKNPRQTELVTKDIKGFLLQQTD